MFAVIRTGGKQYRVRENERIEVERLPGNPGDAIVIDQVLMLGGTGEASEVGAPLLNTAAVFAEVVAQTRGEKLLIFKKKRRKNHRRMGGHRQDLTVLRITGISATGEKPPPASFEEAADGKPAASADEAVPVEGDAVDASDAATDETRA